MRTLISRFGYMIVPHSARFGLWIVLLSAMSIPNSARRETASAGSRSGHWLTLHRTEISPRVGDLYRKMRDLALLGA